MRLTEVLYRIRTLFIPYLIIIIGCLVIKLLFTRDQIYFTINGHHNAFADQFFIYCTDLGTGWLMLILALITLLYSYRTTFLLTTAFLITTILEQTVKRIVRAPRPSVYFKDQLTHIYFVKGVYLLSSNSFPSGHTVQSFSIAVVLTYVARNKSWGFLLLALAILVGFSRMYLSEHFFEDVTAGSVIGTMITIIWLAIIDSKPFLQNNKWERGLLSKNP